MSLRPIDQWFLQHEEPVKSCLHFLREHILAMDEHISESWKYSMPFYNYKGKRFCYIWTSKKEEQPYIGIVDGKLIDHPDLVTENRARMKILPIDPRKNIPVKKINKILNQLLEFYK